MAVEWSCNRCVALQKGHIRVSNTITTCPLTTTNGTVLAKKLSLQVSKVCHGIYSLILPFDISLINQLNLKYCIYIQLSVTPKEIGIICVYANSNRMISLKFIFITSFLAN